LRVILLEDGETVHIRFFMGIRLALCYTIKRIYIILAITGPAVLQILLIFLPENPIKIRICKEVKDVL
jgi:hypothetical protein